MDIDAPEEDRGGGHDLNFDRYRQLTSRICCPIS